MHRFGGGGIPYIYILIILIYTDYIDIYIYVAGSFWYYVAIWWFRVGMALVFKYNFIYIYI